MEKLKAYNFVISGWVKPLQDLNAYLDSNFDGIEVVMIWDHGAGLHPITPIYVHLVDTQVVWLMTSYPPPLRACRGGATAAPRLRARD